MKFYCAGNFPLQKDITKEKRFCLEARQRYGDQFKRLISYFFVEETNNVLQVKRELNQKGE